MKNELYKYLKNNNMRSEKCLIIIRGKVKKRIRITLVRSQEDLVVYMKQSYFQFSTFNLINLPEVKNNNCTVG